MIVACHQPEYWPLPRLLHKWARADLLVLLDDAQFDRASLQHRARLRSERDGQTRWLTVPYRHVGEPQEIQGLQAADPGWPLAHRGRVREWYRGAPPDRLTAADEWFEHTAGGEYWRFVARAAEASMREAADWAAPDGWPWRVPIRRASEIPEPPEGWGEGSARLVALCRAVGADAYLSGETAAGSYLDWGAFRAAGIAVEVQRFPRSGEPELSSLHTFLSEGPEALGKLVLP